MRFTLLTFILPLLSSQILAAPAAEPSASITDLLSSPDIPLLSHLEGTEFNETLSARDDSLLDSRAIRLPYAQYRITLDGRGRGNFQNFVMTGYLIVFGPISSPATKNGRNAHEVLIVVGSPAANPVAGSLRYATNRYLYKLIGGTNAESRLDYAYVKSVGNSIGVTVDTRIAAANQLSVFNARSGFLANVYIVANGGFSFTANTKTLSGTVNFGGRGFIFGGTAPFKASITGVIAGRGTIVL
jgi:hypothetical protein